MRANVATLTLVGCLTLARLGLAGPQLVTFEFPLASYPGTTFVARVTRGQTVVREGAVDASAAQCAGMALPTRTAETLCAAVCLDPGEASFTLQAVRGETRSAWSAPLALVSGTAPCPPSGGIPPVTADPRPTDQASPPPAPPSAPPFAGPPPPPDRTQAEREAQLQAELHALQAAYQQEQQQIMTNYQQALDAAAALDPAAQSAHIRQAYEEALARQQRLSATTQQRWQALVQQGGRRGRPVTQGTSALVVGHGGRLPLDAHHDDVPERVQFVRGQPFHEGIHGGADLVGIHARVPSRRRAGSGTRSLGARIVSRTSMTHQDLSSARR